MSFPAVFYTSALNGTNGFSIPGTSSSWFGWSVASVGDINGDGKADLVVGACTEGYYAATGGGGSVFVIFGTGSFSATFNPATLNGENGFMLTSAEAGLGMSVAGAGDVNGDSIDDLIIGAGILGGKAYVIFGRATFPSQIDVASLNGNNGFTITGPSENFFGVSVAGGGDINGDGKSDLVIGAPSDCCTETVFVIFGDSSFPSVFETSSLDATNGFQVTSSSEHFGTFVAVPGDVNGDGKADLVVGACFSFGCASKAFVIFGASTFANSFDTSSLNGVNGFTITSSNSWFGWNAAGPGDINGDKKFDIFVGTVNSANVAYIIFGQNSFPSTLDTSSLDGTNGFQITSSSGDFGVSGSGIGDFNGDNKSDLAIGADSSSTSYIIFGRNSFPSTLDTSSLNGTNGFSIISESNFGYAIAGAGDINGDGKFDLVVGAYDASIAYVIYGQKYTRASDTLTLSSTTSVSIFSTPTRSSSASHSHTSTSTAESTTTNSDSHTLSHSATQTSTSAHTATSSLSAADSLTQSLSSTRSTSATLSPSLTGSSSYTTSHNHTPSSSQDSLTPTASATQSDTTTPSGYVSETSTQSYSDKSLSASSTQSTSITPSSTPTSSAERTISPSTSLTVTSTGTNAESISDKPSISGTLTLSTLPTHTSSTQFSESATSSTSATPSTSLTVSSSYTTSPAHTTSTSQTSLTRTASATQSENPTPTNYVSKTSTQSYSGKSLSASSTQPTSTTPSFTTTFSSESTISPAGSLTSTSTHTVSAQLSESVTRSASATPVSTPSATLSPVYARAVVNLDYAADSRILKISGPNDVDEIGYSVSGIGDINKDGLSDFLISTSKSNTSATLDSTSCIGESYVVFGVTTKVSCM